MKVWQIITLIVTVVVLFVVYSSENSRKKSIFQDDIKVYNKAKELTNVLDQDAERERKAIDKQISE